MKAAADQLVYLASPYSHPDPAVVEARFEAVCRAAGRLMADGVLVYSPIAHTHPIAVRSALPTGWTYWERYDRAMIAACDHLTVLMLDGWDESRGVTAELAIAGELGRPVTYITRWWARDEPPASEGHVYERQGVPKT